MSLMCGKLPKLINDHIRASGLSWNESRLYHLGQERKWGSISKSVYASPKLLTVGGHLIEKNHHTDLRSRAIRTEPVGSTFDLCGAAKSQRRLAVLYEAHRKFLRRI